MLKNNGEYREPIGVFDSGIGGLTVLKALQERFPNESYIYIGDTARLPYGTKSPETIIRYSQSLTREILKHNVKAIVVACNTASTHALQAVKDMAGDIPVLGMIEPAAKAALEATKNNHIAVIGTFGTIHSDIYAKTLKAMKDDVRVSSIACQLLVALAEEGWAETDIAEDTIKKYFGTLFETSEAPDTLILGCTHFPLFEKVLKEKLGAAVTLINSGSAAAQHLHFKESTGKDGVQFFATDDPGRFAKNAKKFFGHKIMEQEVGLVDI